MANLSFKLVFGDQTVKIKNQPSNTSSDELRKIAEEEFEVKNPVLFYYDEEEKDWLKVNRRFTLSDGDKLKVLRVDENGKVIDPDKGTTGGGQSQAPGATAGEEDAMMVKYKTRIEKVLQSKDKAQGIAYVVGMYDASGVNKDVRGMETVLSDKLNFAVYSETNMSADELKGLIKAAARKSYPLKCKYVVFYYAGHGGITAQGESFVCPIKQPGDKDVVYKDRDIVRVLEEGAATAGKCLLFFFDCCMSNPGNQTSPSDLPANPIHNNCIVANATFFGEVSSGNATFGGNWTRVLSDNLAENKELVNVLNDTNIEVKKKFGQSASIQNHLTQKVNLKASAKYGGTDPYVQSPTVKHMLQLLLKDYASQYDKIGRMLDLDYSDRRTIDTDNVQYMGADRKLEAILNKWKQVKPNATWNDFIKALRNEKMNKLANDVETFLKSKEMEEFLMDSVN